MEGLKGEEESLPRESMPGAAADRQRTASLPIDRDPEEPPPEDRAIHSTRVIKG